MTPDSTLAVTKTCPKDGVHLCEHVREALAVHRCDERPTFEELPRSR